MSSVEFPRMRQEVVAALHSLSDPEHQRCRWGVAQKGVSYYDDLTLNVHILYDDCMVLPDPLAAVPAILHAHEVPTFAELGAALGPMLDELGDRPDADYLADKRWPAVIRAARAALAVMRSSDEGSA